MHKHIDFSLSNSTQMPIYKHILFIFYLAINNREDGQFASKLSTLTACPSPSRNLESRLILSIRSTLSLTAIENA